MTTPEAAVKLPVGFYLRRQSLSSQHVVPIDEERYKRLSHARRTLVDAGAFEQRYELLLGNFVAFEMFCAENSIRGEVERDHRYEVWNSAIAIANRHVMNLLATIRLYADQVVRGFSHLDVVPSHKEEAVRLLRQAYDGTLAYRFLCELRNHAQHRSSVVHGMKGRRPHGQWAMNTMVYCTRETIREERKDFKLTVLDAMEEQIDILMLIRRYMCVVSQIQSNLRRRLEGSINQARADIEQALDDYLDAQNREEDRKTKVAISACRFDVRGWVDVIPLMLDWDNARQILANKNDVWIDVVTSSL